MKQNATAHDVFTVLIGTVSPSTNEAFGNIKDAGIP
jgi:hypothetical protein